MEAVEPRFDVLDSRPTLGELLGYPRFAGMPWYRSFWAVTIGTLAVVGASLAAASLVPRLLGREVVWFLPLIPYAWALIAIFGFVWWCVDYVRRVRLGRFAAANGFGFADLLENQRRIGLGFPSHMRNQERSVIAARVASAYFTVGRNTVMAPRNTERVEIRKPFAFIELDLPSEVPHIILKNRRSRVLPLTGLGLGNSQRLSLGNEFDKVFTLMCPRGYERDALYIFTPNLMAALIDTAADAEVELVDSRVYIYLSRTTPLWRGSTMRSVFALVNALAGRFDRQTLRYADERATAGGTRVALAGRRISAGEGATGLTILWMVAVAALSIGVTAFSLFVVPMIGR